MVAVPEESDCFLEDAIQAIFEEYVLEDGQTTVSRDEAAEIYRKIIKAAR
jgi:hypothetical protein